MISLKFISVLALVILTSCSTVSEIVSLANPLPGGANRPNILFILTDDLDYASIQYMPKLKALIADEGVTFENFIISMPLCCPSRATILRGQYGHNTQILGNLPPAGGFQTFYRLNEEQSTIATWLQRSGYRTMLAGKYMNGFPERTNLMYIPPGWSEWYSAVRGNAYSSYNYVLNENGKQVVYGTKPEDYGTDVYARKTVDLIERAAKQSEPFFAYVSLYVPHTPATPAPRHAHAFPGARAPRTPNFDEADVSDKPAHIRNRPRLTDRQIAEIDELYRKRLQSLLAVDDLIEQAISALAAHGQLENTFIFFTSDNGFHLGNHRQTSGKIAPYEEETRVTMIVRGPGVPKGKALSHLTGNIDLAPTWAELAGAMAADFVDGRSLVPLLRSVPPPVSSWRQAFLIENGVFQGTAARGGARRQPNTPIELLEPRDEDEESETLEVVSLSQQQVRLAIPPYRGIRAQDYVYVEYITGEKELYDLQNDPYQLTNLSSTANSGLIALFSARLKTLMTCRAAACRAAEDAPFSQPP